MHFSELFVDHVSNTITYAEAVKIGNLQKQEKSVKNLLDNMRYWNMDNQELTQDFQDLFKEHILSAKKLVDGAFICPCNTGLGEGDLSCRGNVMVKESLNELSSNLETITVILNNGFPHSELETLKEFWNMHLDCTGKYVDALRIGKNVKNCHYVERKEICIDFAYDFGEYLDEITIQHEQ